MSVTEWATLHQSDLLAGISILSCWESTEYDLVSFEKHETKKHAQDVLLAGPS